MNAHGLLVVDKPSGVTSRDVVNRVQRLLPRKTKIGHAGTLDPLATGVLVLAIGQGTRLIEYVQDQPKVYRTRIRFGARSTTDDADGTITPTPNAEPVPRDQLTEALASYVGMIDQVPPDYSAARIDGQRAYDLARRGADVMLSARAVRIDRIDVCEYVWPDLEIEVHCGKGTYIRAIARDVGEALNVGGYVTILRRTAIGSFTTAQAMPDTTTRHDIGRYLLPITVAVDHWPKLMFNPPEIERLCCGQFIPCVAPNGDTVIVDATGQLIALGVVDNDLFKPDKVLAVRGER